MKRATKKSLTDERDFWWAEKQRLFDKLQSHISADKFKKYLKVNDQHENARRRYFKASRALLDFPPE
jgi:hypothetical protein